MKAAEKAMKRDQKVKKFFGLDGDTGVVKKTWRRHFEPDSNFRVESFAARGCARSIVYHSLASRAQHQKRPP